MISNVFHDNNQHQLWRTFHIYFTVHWAKEITYDVKVKHPKIGYSSAHFIHTFRADSRFVPSQWETLLWSNTISHWLDTNLKSALYLDLHSDGSDHGDQRSGPHFLCHIVRELTTETLQTCQVKLTGHKSDPSWQFNSINEWAGYEVRLQGAVKKILVKSVSIIPLILGPSRVLVEIGFGSSFGSTRLQNS